jgi:hypothetical protein
MRQGNQAPHLFDVSLYVLLVFVVIYYITILNSCQFQKIFKNPLALFLLLCYH